ncbi:hypothetical protein BALAC2494_02039 [Bifidobacterium animalis subsp. lactis CNCM I-2494]|uniref:Uncharacterized protein n=1 Tax=Bifidobacterium animalis subsp. lactis CNCM I-2494 TaxID=1042403 RepID=A0A806FYH3_BIFAN|nr:hypothetical protein BALAC2494_02039 [Bifidobacterium animalis subsp. lactis CNCM I-2494]
MAPPSSAPSQAVRCLTFPIGARCICGGGTSASWLRTAPSAMPWEHLTRCSTCCWKRNASPATRFTKCLQTAVRRRSSQPPPIRTTPWRWRLRRPIIRTSSKRNSVRMAIWTSRCSAWDPTVTSLPCFRICPKSASTTLMCW